MNLENKNKIYNEAENTVIVEDYDDFEEKIVPSEKLGRVGIGINIMMVLVI